MIEIKDKWDCCGCSACAQICPKQCISMGNDEEGFQYPKVAKTACIDCDLCRKVCPQQAGQIPHSDLLIQPEAYGGWHKEESVLAESSSGGAFTLLAENILAEGGSVYGCILDEQLRAVHVKAQEPETMSAMRGSKYVQSDINGTYEMVWCDLKAGRIVLFTGAPCQTAGLHSYLETKIDSSSEQLWKKLYLCDFICHGVPSPKVFAGYLHAMEQRYQDTIVSFKFRMKDKPWNPTGFQLGTGARTETGRFIRKYPGYKDPYMNGFLSDLYLRPSCYACKFKYIPKEYSDFTIADFWGVNKIQSSLLNGKGTSLLLIHNQHGKALFDKVKDKFDYEPVEFERAISRNRSLLASAKRNPRRTEFFENYAKLPFGKIEKQYMKASDWFFYRLDEMVRKLLLMRSRIKSRRR